MTIRNLADRIARYGFSRNIACDPAEGLAVLYIILPVFVFFTFFIRLRFAIPACSILLYAMYATASHTRWNVIFSDWPITLYFAAIAAVWLWLGGAGGTFFQGGDWIKHYGVLNELIEKPWPPIEHVTEHADDALRYYIAWYMVPAGILKITGLHAQNFLLSTWSFIGVTLFFHLLSGVFESRKAAYIAPLVFILFSGADIIGTAITHVQVGPVYHIEWWSSWIQYASNTTSLYWVPQHAIPAWLVVVMMMRQMKRRTVLPVLGIVMVSTLLWSPFAALGLAPFFAVLMVRYGFNELAFNWRTWAAIVAIGIPILIYLNAGTSGIPHGFVWNQPCGLDNGYCFNARTYWLFILLEIAGPLAVLAFARIERLEFLLTAAASLCLLPLVHVGVGNDLATRGSICGLAVISILCTQALVERSRLTMVMMSAVLLVGIPTSGGEMLRAFVEPSRVSQDSKIEEVWAGRIILRAQYFAPLPIEILRAPH